MMQLMWKLLHSGCVLVLCEHMHERMYLVYMQCWPLKLSKAAQAEIEKLQQDLGRPELIPDPVPGRAGS